MSFNWLHYLQLAELLNESESEAAKRAAISRAYYAVFCVCRNYVRDKKELLPAGTVDDHNSIIFHFLASKETERKRIGELLRRLRNDRNSADYDDELSGIPDNMAEKAIKSAREILELIKIL